MQHHNASSLAVDCQLFWRASGWLGLTSMLLRLRKRLCRKMSRQEGNTRPLWDLMLIMACLLQSKMVKGQSRYREPDLGRGIASLCQWVEQLCIDHGRNNGSIHRWLHVHKGGALLHCLQSSAWAQQCHSIAQRLSATVLGLCMQHAHNRAMFGTNIISCEQLDELCAKRGWAQSPCLGVVGIVEVCGSRSPLQWWKGICSLGRGSCQVGCESHWIPLLVCTCHPARTGDISLLSLLEFEVPPAALTLS